MMLPITQLPSQFCIIFPPSLSQQAVFSQFGAQQPGYEGVPWQSVQAWTNVFVG